MLSRYTVAIMPENNADLKAPMLEVQVEAAMQGRDLGPFESVGTLTGGYQAECRQCGKTVWVSGIGLFSRFFLIHPPSMCHCELIPNIDIPWERMLK